jgi:hypothetical protein
MALPRKFSLVKYIGPSEFDYPFKLGREFVFISGIINMPEKCIVMDYNNGRMYSGYFMKDFVELTKEEIE